MHIHKFADLCEFSEIGVNGTFEETQKYRQFLKNLHPRQILNMHKQISLAPGRSMTKMCGSSPMWISGTGHILICLFPMK